ncbi:MAG TPA: hypothetical protein VIK33_05270 [Anaerolineae bacterium]
MGIFNRILGKGGKAGTFKLGLADPGHPARQQIDLASRIADDAIQLMAAGDSTMLSTNSADGARLVEAIDTALAQPPDDLDLLVAKSGALCCALQFKTAEEVIDRVLSIDPNHFEARQRKAHWEKWSHLFQFPSWSATTGTLHPVMAAHLRHARQVQLVRDGLQIGVAVVRPVQRQDVAPGLSNRMRSKWEPVWSNTPSGAVVAHYLLVEDDASNPFRAEGFLPTYTPDEATPAAGYWLLQRMSRINSCFLVLTDGQQVLYNVRYAFPDALKSTLHTIVERMERQPTRPNTAAFQQAMQWHMNNFDMKRIRF